MDAEVTSIIARKISREWNFGIMDGQRTGFNDYDEPDNMSLRSFPDLFQIGARTCSNEREVKEN